MSRKKDEKTKDTPGEELLFVPPPEGGAAAGPEGASEKQSIEGLKAAFETLEGDVRVAEDKYLRALADIDNMRKRIAREKEEWLRYGHGGIVKDLLTIIDNLERALSAATELMEGEVGDLANKGLIEGVELTLKEMMKALERYGIAPIESVGQPFDPNLHEAVQQICRDDVPAGTVVEQFLKGYLIHDRLLRPAKVVVSAEPDTAIPGEFSEEGAEDRSDD